jgi:hypothetical protein
MDINRNNYENYFLLYIDDELCAADRKAVEAFVQQHTDLQQELAMLQQTVLKAEPITFEAKNSLLKTGEAIQEKLLLLLDDELSPADAAVLNKQLLQDASLQQEWNILQHTKLPQETVVFERKELLLRKEPARIVMGKWWRAAAAVFIGIGLAGTLLLVNKNKTGGSDAALAKATTNTGNPGTAATENSAAGKTAAAKENIIPANEAAPKAGADAQAVAALEQNAGTAEKTLPGTVKGSSKVAQQQNPVVVAKQKTTQQIEKNAIKERLQNFNKEESNETYTADVLRKENISQPAATELIKTAANKEAAGLNPENVLKTNNAAHAINTKNDAGIAMDYLTPDEKSNRRSGLVRKVSRFLQRSTKKKADGDGLKIAGFEFAVR